MAARVCIIEECGQKLPENGTVDICHQCRSGFYYWGKKTPADVKQRKKQLTKLQNRFENMPSKR